MDSATGYSQVAEKTKEAEEKPRELQPQILASKYNVRAKKKRKKRKRKIGSAHGSGVDKRSKQGPSAPATFDYSNSSMLAAKKEAA